MTTTEALSTYREKISQLHALNHAMGALSYDGSTAAPVEAAEGRGKTLSYLSNWTAGKLKYSCGRRNIPPPFPRRNMWPTLSC